MNENAMLMKQKIDKKKTAQMNLQKKRDGLAAYMVVQQNTMDRYEEGMALNASDIERMEETFEKVMVKIERHEQLQEEVKRMQMADTWAWGDPMEDKLENQPEYIATLAEYMGLVTEFEDAKTEVNKIFYRR